MDQLPFEDLRSLAFGNRLVQELSEIENLSPLLQELIHSSQEFFKLGLVTGPYRLPRLGRGDDWRKVLQNIVPP